jgi:hypothetical protein
MRFQTSTAVALEASPEQVIVPGSLQIPAIRVAGGAEPVGRLGGGASAGVALRHARAGGGADRRHAGGDLHRLVGHHEAVGEAPEIHQREHHHEEDDEDDRELDQRRATVVLAQLRRRRDMVARQFMFRRPGAGR